MKIVEKSLGLEKPVLKTKITVDRYGGGSPEYNRLLDQGNSRGRHVWDILFAVSRGPSANDPPVHLGY